MKPAASPCAPVRVSLGSSAAYHMPKGEWADLAASAPASDPTLQTLLAVEEGRSI